MANYDRINAIIATKICINSMHKHGNSFSWEDLGVEVVGWEAVGGEVVFAEVVDRGVFSVDKFSVLSKMKVIISSWTSNENINLPATVVDGVSKPVSNK